MSDSTLTSLSTPSTSPQRLIIPEEHVKNLWTCVNLTAKILRANEFEKTGDNLVYFMGELQKASRSFSIDTAPTILAKDAFDLVKRGYESATHIEGYGILRDGLDALVNATSYVPEDDFRDEGEAVGTVKEEKPQHPPRPGFEVVDLKGEFDSVSQLEPGDLIVFSDGTSHKILGDNLKKDYLRGFYEASIEFGNALVYRPVESPQPPAPTLHKLKTWPDPFAAVLSGDKTAEIRKADRDFKVGDHMWLEEFDPSADVFDEYSGRKVKTIITHVLKGPIFGITEGYAMLSFKAAEGSNLLEGGA